MYLIKAILILFFLSISLLHAEGSIETYEVNLSPNYKSITEGNSGTKSVTFTITIDKCPSFSNINIDYYTQDSSAQSGSDYIEKSGTITFNTGSCDKTQSVDVLINGDTDIENDEKFYFKIEKSSSTSLNVSISNDSSRVTIENDDEAEKHDVDLSIGKWADTNRIQKNREFEYGIEVGYSDSHRGDTKVKVIDDIPSDLEIVNVNDNGDFDCSVNGNRVTCITKKNIEDYSGNPVIGITVKSKVDNKTVTNTASVTHLNTAYNEVDPDDNEDSATVETIDENLEDEVEITKEIVSSFFPFNPFNSYSVGDEIKFKITATNIGYSKKIAIRDKFPLGGDSWGTTGSAFEFISYEKPNDVTCEYDYHDGDKYLFCYTNNKYNDGDSFEVTITAKILKGGHLCNTAHAYEYSWDWRANSTVCLDATGNGAPILIQDIPNQEKLVDKYMTKVKLDQYFKDPEGEELTYSVTGLPQNATYKPNKKWINGKLTQVGEFNVTVTATDPQGASATTSFIIKVKPRDLKAKADNYNISINTKLISNIFDNDYGSNIKLVSNTNPSHGTLEITNSGDIKYTPNYNFVGQDKFKYTITDDSNKTSTAWVKINIKTTYHASFADFKILNPQDTRNILGNYVIIGNTLSCVTAETNKYIGECQDNTSYNNNNYMVKYIDIDGSNNLTWNSSSANFTLPDSFASDSNKSIAWAGLFWQGAVNNYSTTTPQRRAKISNNQLIYENITPASGDIDFNTIGADKVLIKIDNNTTYTTISSSDFYYDQLFGSKGGFYAGYADITAFLNSAKLSKGKHKITLANIVANEGLEPNVGNYAGWSLVIIYKESGFSTKPKNITVFGGYVAMGEGNKQAQFKVEGFRLPKEGDVNSNFSLFSGEGDYLYGGDKNKDYDLISIKESNSSEPKLMPNLTEKKQYNIFDAKIKDIDRDSNSNNKLQNNNNGIDVDTYNVSSIMTQFRDNNEKIDSVILEMKTDGEANGDDQTDYFTPSMIAFSTDLYAPKLCYDYSVKMGDAYSIESKDRNFTVSQFGDNDLQIKVMIRSQEADFDIENTKMYLTFSQDNTFRFNKDKAQVSLPNTFIYNSAVIVDENQGSFAIGSDPSATGGLIKSKDRIYTKTYFDFLQPHFEGQFNIILEGDIKFDGKNPVHYIFSSNAPKGSTGYIERCPINQTYNPVYGQFNVERGDSDTNYNDTNDKKYSLFTQVTGVPYEISVVSYKNDNGNFDTEEPIDTTVELELIDASNFENNNSDGYDSTCEDPDSVAGKGVFVNMGNSSRKKLTIPNAYPNYPTDVALKNATFRVWILTKKVGSQKQIVNYNCNSSDNNSSCFIDLYNNEFKSLESNSTKFCEAKCQGSNATNSKCYQCLKDNYGQPICARDNFAIRPDSYYIKVSDSNETKNPDEKIKIGDNYNNTTIAQLAAGYKYDIDVNATIFNSTQNAKWYYFLSDNNNSLAKSLIANNPYCVDTNDTKIDLTIENGTTRHLAKDNNGSFTNMLSLNNVGRYEIKIIDSKWTEVDQAGSKYKPFKNLDDCEANNHDAKNGQNNAKRGCLIESGVGSSLSDLYIRSHPYRFDVSNINAQSSSNPAHNYIYLNSIDMPYALSEINTDNVMALKVSSSIKAFGKDGKLLTNYKSGCMAEDLDISYSYTTDRPNIQTVKFGNPLELLYTIYDRNVDNSINDINRTQSQNIPIDFNAKYFYTAGIGSFNMYLNYKRYYNDPVSAFRFNSTRFYVQSPQDRSTVDLNSSYMPIGLENINNLSNIFYYAATLPKVGFGGTYYDTYGDSIDTPFAIVNYCDTNCANYGINTNSDLSNENNWWYSRNHDGLTEGHVIATLDANSNQFRIDLTPIQTYNAGIKEDARVFKVQNPNIHYPHTVVVLPYATMINKYSYLLYNKDSLNDVAPPYLWKNIFVNDPNAWSGKGKTGFTTDTNNTGRRNKRGDW